MIAYIFFRIAIFIFRLLPFPVIYLISDFFAFFMRDIFRYRREVIVHNLEKSFPEKTEKQRRKIMRKFYQHLTDLTVESIKGNSLTEKQIKKRYTYTNKELGNHFFDLGKKIIYAGGHYGNWEWGGISTPIELKHKIYVLYKPLANKRIDNYLKKMRSKHSARMLSIYMPNKDIFFNSEKDFALVMVGDQNPSNLKRAIWINFLNQPTACLHGIEAYAKNYDLPVVFFSINKKKRGFYEITFKLITEKPKNEDKGQITLKYMCELEKVIKNKPEYWLWSHKRWKHKFDETKYNIVG